MGKASFIVCYAHDTRTHLTCQERTASHKHGAMQPEDRRHQDLPSAHSRRWLDRTLNAASRWCWKNSEQHGDKLHDMFDRDRSIRGRRRRHVRWYGLAFALLFHTAGHATGRRLHRHSTGITMGHDAKQMGRPKCDDDHDSEKAGVHVSVTRKTAGSEPTRQTNCPHPVEHLIRPKPSANLLMRNLRQNLHTFRKGLSGPWCYS